MNVLGLSADTHDTAACLVVDGVMIAAAQEERFSGQKNEAHFPVESLRFCLRQAKMSASQIDAVALSGKAALFHKELLAKALGADIDWGAKLLFVEHHLAHIASAFFPSPFEEAAILTLDDALGRGVTTSLATGKGNDFSLQQKISHPHALGLLYSAITSFTGFKPNEGEYKIMGLAPYGAPRFVRTIRDQLIDIKGGGAFTLNMDFLDDDFATMNKRLASLFEGAARQADAPLTQRDMDLAASVQAVIEEVVLKLAATLRKETGQQTLCLAGEVALNCVANGKLARSGLFEKLWVQPAAGDAGLAIGAALWAYHKKLQQPRTAALPDGMNGTHLGPAFTQEECEARLTKAGAIFDVLTEKEVIEMTAQALAEGKAVGWHQGRMEFGPRALGNRSILADPRAPTMQKKLNEKVKNRESFRPFAPSILREDAAEWFQLDGDSPYMLVVTDVTEAKQKQLSPEETALVGLDRLGAPRSVIPAVTHIDGSARVQTVGRETNPLFHNLLTRFKELTGCPVLVNTSFNVRGKPIVCSPEDAFHCFMGTEIELLVVGHCVLKKENQPV